LIVFDTSWHALNFAQKVHASELRGDVATYRDGEAVYVIDGSENGARERIMALSRTSSATHARAIR
jgi:hypothetical protein